MPPVLDLLQFTHSRKAAFAIWCFDLTTVIFTFLSVARLRKWRRRWFIRLHFL